MLAKLAVVPPAEGVTPLPRPSRSPEHYLSLIFRSLFNAPSDGDAAATTCTILAGVDHMRSLIDEAKDRANAFEQLEAAYKKLRDGMEHVHAMLAGNDNGTIMTDGALEAQVSLLVGHQLIRSSELRGAIIRATDKLGYISARPNALTDSELTDRLTYAVAGRTC